MNEIKLTEEMDNSDLCTCSFSECAKLLVKILGKWNICYFLKKETFKTRHIMLMDIAIRSSQTLVSDNQQLLIRYELSLQSMRV